MLCRTKWALERARKLETSRWASKAREEEPELRVRGFEKRNPHPQKGKGLTLLRGLKTHF